MNHDVHKVRPFEHPGQGRKRAKATPKGRQVDPTAAHEIEQLLGDRPRRRDLLIEHLHLIQDHYGSISAAHLAALYRDATCFVMPSTDEGFGLVYLEAMTASVPCIAAHGAAEEVITNGRDGLIVDAADQNALVDAMVRLFRDPVLRGRIAAAAGERVRGEFGAAALANRVSDVLELPASR